MTGGWASVRVIDWLAVEVLPEQSITLQVRTRVPRPQASKPLLSSTGKSVAETLASQSSVAVRGIAGGKGDVQLRLIFAGTLLITGRAASLSVISWLAVVVLPEQSVTLQLRTRVPRPQASKPLLSSTGRPVAETLASQSSEADSGAAGGSTPQLMVIFPGTGLSIVGGPPSCKVIFWVMVVVLPEQSENRPGADNHPYPTGIKAAVVIYGWAGS